MNRNVNKESENRGERDVETKKKPGFFDPEIPPEPKPEPIATDREKEMALRKKKERDAEETQERYRQEQKRRDADMDASREAMIKEYKAGELAVNAPKASLFHVVFDETPIQKQLAKIAQFKANLSEMAKKKDALRDERLALQSDPKALLGDSDLVLRAGVLLAQENVCPEIIARIEEELAATVEGLRQLLTDAGMVLFPAWDAYKTCLCAQYDAFIAPLCVRAEVRSTFNDRFADSEYFRWSLSQIQFIVQDRLGISLDRRCDELLALLRRVRSTGVVLPPDLK
jgi:hypothetical protein